MEDVFLRRATMLNDQEYVRVTQLGELVDLPEHCLHPFPALDSQLAARRKGHGELRTVTDVRRLGQCSRVRGGQSNES